MTLRILLLWSCAIFLIGCGTPDTGAPHTPSATVLATLPTARQAPINPVAVPTAFPPTPTAELPTTRPTERPPAQSITMTDTPEPTPGDIPAQPAPTTLPTRPVRPASAIQPPTSPGGEAAILPDELLTSLRNDLAARSASNPADIRLISAEAIIWNDGALGCPQPGVHYTQEPIAGYRVLLEASGRTYDYRVGKRNRFVLCTQP